MPAPSTARWCGTADPALTYSILSGKITGETPKFDGSLLRTAGENVGKYEILKNSLKLVNDEDNNFIASNYNLIYKPQYLTITAKDLNDSTILLYYGMKENDNN